MVVDRPVDCADGCALDGITGWEEYRFVGLQLSLLDGRDEGI
jgi:hypothetical protein